MEKMKNIQSLPFEQQLTKICVCTVVSADGNVVCVGVHVDREKKVSSSSRPNFLSVLRASVVFCLLELLQTAE